MDGLWPAQGEQLEPVGQFELADLRAADASRTKNAGQRRSTRFCAAWTASWCPTRKDGGCDEGPGYWSRAGASLFDNLELLLQASGGKIDEFGSPLVREIGRFVYRAHIAGRFYLNFADAQAVLHPDPNLIFSYGKRIAGRRNGLLWRLAGRSRRRIAQRRAAPSAISPPAWAGCCAGCSICRPCSAQKAQAPLVRDVFLPEIQVMAARDQGGTAQGLYVAAKGGNNDESHNHNDVGNFVTYIDGKPVLVDVGVETYTRKTFSPQRYEIWTMQSGYHSLPTINGVDAGARRGLCRPGCAVRRRPKTAPASRWISPRLTRPKPG